MSAARETKSSGGPKGVVAGRLRAADCSMHGASTGPREAA